MTSVFSSFSGVLLLGISFTCLFTALVPLSCLGYFFPKLASKMEHSFASTIFSCHQLKGPYWWLYICLTQDPIFDFLFLDSSM